MLVTLRRVPQSQISHLLLMKYRPSVSLELNNYYLESDRDVIVSSRSVLSFTNPPMERHGMLACTLHLNQACRDNGTIKGHRLANNVRCVN